MTAKTDEISTALARKHLLAQIAGNVAAGIAFNRAFPMVEPVELELAKSAVRIAQAILVEVGIKKPGF